MTPPTAAKVAKNGTLYFASLALPALAAAFLVPVTVRALGPSRFGLLALAWALAEGTGMFDLGLARTTVRFVADATAKGQDRLREIIVASVFSQAAMGCLAGLLVFALAPFLANHVFKVSPELVPEAIAMFRVLSLHVPVLLASQALRATLEGAQRFDISTALRVPGSLASIIIPALVAPAGGALSTILWLLLAVRAVLLVFNVDAVRRVLLGGGWLIRPQLQPLREMLGYSGWVAVSAVLGPALGSFERFVTGSIVGVASLGFYTGAAELANRFFLIPATAFAALLPALANSEARGARDRALAACRAGRRQLAAALFPFCLALLVFAPTVLRGWLGPDYAAAGATALRILAIGVFLGGLAHLPLGLLYGAARPDLPAKIHLGEAIVYLPLTFVLVHSFGIPGAALSWTLRCTADLALYEWASRRAIGRCEVDFSESARARRLALLGAGLAATFALIAWADPPSVSMGLILIALGLGAYGIFAWTKVLTVEERGAWMSMVSRPRQSA
ncbi:MAG: oligosaccharide flippase family protein [Gemmatimonadaceae bacterium]